jgi:putative transposase
MAPLLQRIGAFADFLAAREEEAAVMAIRRSYSTGRPVGAAEWIRLLEGQTRRHLAAAKRGPKPKAATSPGSHDPFSRVSP